jgi:hypothetical protein
VISLWEHSSGFDQRRFSVAQVQILLISKKGTSPSQVIGGASGHAHSNWSAYNLTIMICLKQPHVVEQRRTIQYAVSYLVLLIL